MRRRTAECRAAGAGGGGVARSSCDWRSQGWRCSDRAGGVARSSSECEPLTGLVGRHGACADN